MHYKKLNVSNIVGGSEAYQRIGYNTNEDKQNAKAVLECKLLGQRYPEL
jgi:hypothetical protein